MYQSHYYRYILELLNVKRIGAEFQKCSLKEMNSIEVVSLLVRGPTQESSLAKKYGVGLNEKDNKMSLQSSTGRYIKSSYCYDIRGELNARS